MTDGLVSWWLRRLGGVPCFRVWGKARREKEWRVLDVFAAARRDMDSRWPLWGGACTTWSSSVVAVGWDFALALLCEQADFPASRARPVEVAGGRMRDVQRRKAAGALSIVSASEIMAHECGHTSQAQRLGPAYLPVVGSVTLLREGPHWWNHFENDASEQGQFGGIVNGSVCQRLMDHLSGLP
jgi:hypothetical protein